VTRSKDDEVIVLDEAEIWLRVRALAADATSQLASTCEPTVRRRIGRVLARHLGLEIRIVNSREAVALQEALTAFESALTEVAG
jgi:hypothetical protein